MRFVILEYPDITFGSSFTASRPGVTIDSISSAPIGPPDNRRHPAVVLAQGLSRADRETLVTGFQHIYDDLQTLQNDPHRGRWIGRFTVRERALAGSVLHKVLGFQGEFGQLWTHAEDGIVHLRARVKDEAHGDELATAIRERLAKDGVEAQIEVREIDVHDHGTWDELVQASIGLAT